MIQTVANASTWRSLACVALVATLLPLSTAAQTFNDPRQRARDRAAARPP